MGKNDLGELMRYTIWVDFQADMHRHAEGKGKFFCRVENGKAKLFVDIRK